jgi:hypothetical protein
MLSFGGMNGSHSAGLDLQSGKGPGQMQPHASFKSLLHAMQRPEGGSERRRERGRSISETQI